MEVPTLIYLGDWFDGPETEWPRIREQCVRRFADAAVLGAPYVIAGPPAGTADLATGARRYRELLKLGSAEGSLPAFEFLGFVGQYCSIDSALRVLESCGDSRGTTVLDPFHIFRGGGSLEDVARLRGNQIAVSHFNDTPSSPARELQHDADRVWPGEGHLNLRRYLQLLEETGYRGCVSLELFREDLWARNPYEVAREGLERMKQMLGAEEER